jgi:hypothetical protein
VAQAFGVILYTIFDNLPKENNLRLGETSPNLVTLFNVNKWGHLTYFFSKKMKNDLSDFEGKSKQGVGKHTLESVR